MNRALWTQCCTSIPTRPACLRGWMFRRPATPWTAGTKVAVISHLSNTPLAIINPANVSFDCGRTLSQLKACFTVLALISAALQRASHPQVGAGRRWWGYQEFQSFLLTSGLVCTGAAELSFVSPGPFFVHPLLLIHCSISVWQHDATAVTR